MAAKKSFTDGYKRYDTSKGYGSQTKWQYAFEERLNLHHNTIEETESKKDYYQSLYDCNTAEELKKTYWRLMKQYHPDIAGDTLENKIIAQSINDIFFKLKNTF